MSIQYPTFVPNFGASCHQRRQGDVPVCIITDLASSALLFSNDPYNEGPGIWTIASVNVYLQRFWATSTAKITLTCNLPSTHRVPPELPLIDGHYIQPEDEICIYLGHLPLLRPATLEDIEAQYLNRVYIGSIDTIACISTAKGEAITIECRDRMKFLMDTRFTLDPNFDDSDGNWFKSIKDKQDSVPRSDLILMASRFGIGDIRPPDDQSAEGLDSLGAGGATEGGIDGQIAEKTQEVTTIQKLLDESEGEPDNPSILKLKEDLQTKQAELARLQQQKAQGSTTTDTTAEGETEGESTPEDTAAEDTEQPQADGETGNNAGSSVVLNGRIINYGYVQDLQKITSGQGSAEIQGALAPPDLFYNCATEHSGGEPPLRARAFTHPKELDLLIKFHIYTNRLGFKAEGAEREFTLQDQIPIELIKHLAMQEPFPTEVFCNHLDGDFYYAPRMNDFSGFSDPKRFYRTYYVKRIPPEVGEDGTNDLASFEVENLQTEGLFVEDSSGACSRPSSVMGEDTFSDVDLNQMVINFKEEFSSLALATNFFVSNSAPTGTKKSKDIAMTLSLRPAWLRGLNIAGRNKFIYDETITNLGEAAAVAFQQARIFAKELKSASMTLLGDPTLCPGETIQVIGSALYRDSSISLSVAIEERQAYVEYESVMLESYFSALEVVHTGVEGDTSDVKIVDSVTTAPASQGVERAGKHEIAFKMVDKNSDTHSFMASAADPDKASWVNGSSKAKEGGFTQSPKTIWRVEGVRHSFNSGGQKGYMTEVSLVNPFN